MLSPKDNHTFKAIRKGDSQAFERLFRELYRPMVAYAFRFLEDMSMAENMVQDVFTKLWQKRRELVVTTSLSSYLFRSVRNLCLNRIEHQKIKSGYAKMVIEDEKERTDFSDFYMEVGLREKIEAAIASLPEKRQEIFRMAREEGLKYREIAEKLNISVKTVETQMGLALKQLREALKDYRHLVMFFFAGPQTNAQKLFRVRPISAVIPKGTEHKKWFSGFMM